MAYPEVLLVFPPLVATNFGRYYPSTALLSSYLEQAGISTGQMDINQTLLEYLICPSNTESVLAEEEKTLAQVTSYSASSNLVLKELLAARAIRNRSGCFKNSINKLLPAGHPRAPTEILAAVAHRYYIDVPPKILISSKFWKLPDVIVSQEFLNFSGILDGVPDSVRVVGISIPMGPQLAWALILAKAFRQRFKARVVIGGQAITLLRRTTIEALLLSHKDISCVIQHHGEIPLLDLVKHYREGKEKPWAVPGVLAIKHGTLKSSSKKVKLLNHKDLPFGLYEPEILKRLAMPEISIRQSEGCYWGRCAYCDYIELYPKDASRYRPQPIDKILSEIEYHINKYGVRRFRLITEAIPPKVGRDMAIKFLEMGFDIKWNSFAMVDEQFDLKTLCSMTQSGCEYLVIGLETTNDRLLSLIRKKATKAACIRFFRNCRKAGIKLVINLIPNLPTTTREEALYVLDIITEYLDCFSGISIFPFEVTRSSEIGRNPEAYGLELIKTDNFETGQAEFQGNHLPVRDLAMTKEELENVIEHYRRIAGLAGRDVCDSGLAKFEPDFTNKNERWQIDGKYVDIIIPENDITDLGPILFDWLKGSMLNFSNLWTPIFRWIQEQCNVTSGEIAKQVGIITNLGGIERDAVASFVIRRISDQGFIRRIK